MIKLQHLQIRPENNMTIKTLKFHLAKSLLTVQVVAYMSIYLYFYSMIEFAITDVAYM